MPLDTTELTSRLDVAIAAAAQASELILRYYLDADLDVISKADATPVTIADQNAELLIREIIEKDFPEDGILGEEHPEKVGSNGMKWILDPIDGTKSFVHGVPLFGTLIGLECEGEMVLGVCRFPAINEVVYAAQGQGCWWKIGDREPRRARVSENSSLADATFTTTTMTRWEKIGKKDVYEHLAHTCKLTRGWGDCYGHVLVATGRTDLMIDPELSAWDAAALVPILQEAGGHWIDFDGKASIYTGNGMAVTDALKDTVLELLK